jgi:hypothetical protein
VARADLLRDTVYPLRSISNDRTYARGLEYALNLLSHQPRDLLVEIQLSPVPIYEVFEEAHTAIGARVA